MDCILVVGATGQLGRAVIQKLAHRGVRIRALVRTAENVALFNKLGTEAVRGDLTDRAGLGAACRGVTTIIATANAAIPTRSADTFEAVERGGYRNQVRCDLNVGGSVPEEEAHDDSRPVALHG